MSKKKKSFQKPKSPRYQKSTRAQIYFFTNFKSKTKYNMNFPRQIKSFDTNIMFDSFFISVPFLSIPFFHNKSKLIGL
jgi:hypothetical protein